MENFPYIQLRGVIQLKTNRVHMPLELNRLQQTEMERKGIATSCSSVTLFKCNFLELYLPAKIINRTTPTIMPIVFSFVRLPLLSLGVLFTEKKKSPEKR